MMNTKKTAFGITIATGAAALLTLGAVAPAMASDNTDSSSTSRVTHTVAQLVDGNTGEFSDTLRLVDLGTVSNSSPVVLAPSVSTGDIASGNAVGSGNDVTAPLLSGNDSAVGSGNSGSVSTGSIGTSVSNLVNGAVSGNSGSTGDISGSVSNLVNSILADH
jgi:hypothetical protein